MVLLYFITVSSSAQFCDSGTCYKQDACYNEKDIYSQDYNYATVSNIYMSSTASVQLFMTVYSPCSLPGNTLNKKTILSCYKCKRPFILLIHGGGFRDGCKTLMINECIEFAKRGYVAATIDYRIGWIPGDEQKACNSFCYTSDCSATQANSCSAAYNDSLNFAVYRAIQDASAAMRFMMHNAAPFKIDTNYVYVGGYSAGSIIAANLCYMRQAELDDAMPGVSAVLGPVNTSGNTYNESYRIAGFYNNWGSIKDTSYIKGLKDDIPMIAFHGIDDNIVPFGWGSVLGCKNHAYDHSSGSKLIYTRLVNKYYNLPVELYACYGGHGIFTGDPDKNTKALYRIQKAVCFFNRVRNGDRTRTDNEINEEQDDITYEELDSLWPVNCVASPDSRKVSVASNANNSIISNEVEEATLSISPNPALSAAALSINTKFTRANIIITSLVGKVIWRKENLYEKTIALPVKDLAVGMYIIIVHTDNWNASIRFLKPGY